MATSKAKVPFDLEIVEGLGRIGATAAEMTYVLPAGQSTIEHRLADAESDFHKAYRKGQSLLKASPRRKQIAVAMTGNVTMLIWLGKQHLKQSDRQEVITLTPEQAERLSDRALERCKAGEPLDVILKDPSSWRNAPVH